MIRLGLASSDRQALYSQTSSQQHLYPASPAAVQRPASFTIRPVGSSLSQWFHSNHIPNSKDNEEETSRVASFPIALENSSSLVAKELSNLFHPMSGENHSSVPLLLRQYTLSESLEDSALRRRHTEDSKTKGDFSPKELKRLKKMERQKRREEKKKKREKQKGKRRKNNNKRLHQILKNKDVQLHEVDGKEYLDCCPSKFIVVEKQVGKDRNNHAVEVRPSQQYFYERVCLPDIEGKECVFPAKSLRKGVETRCAQEFSFVQAQVRPYRSDLEWQLDYIHVRSGCACQVNVSSKINKKNKK